MKVLFTCVAIVISFSCYCQDTISSIRKNSLGLSIGIMKVSLLDELNSPLIYQSSPKTLNLSFSRSALKSITEISVFAGRGSFLPKEYPERWLYNTTYDFDGTATRDSVMLGGGLWIAAFQISHLRLVNQNSKKQIYLGGELKDKLLYPGAFVRVGLINAITLSLTAKYNIKFSNKSRITLHAGIPVLAYNTRFPYHSTLSHPTDKEVKMLFKQGAEFTSWHKFQSVDFGIDYHYSLSYRFDLSLKYAFNWLRYQSPKPIKLFSNQLQAGVNYKF